MPRVLISDPLEAPGKEVLQQAGIEVDDRPGLAGSALREALRQADGIIIRSGTRLTAELLEDPGRLRVIVRAGVGVDNIDVPAATRRGLVVMNTPGGNTVSTAEHTISLLTALARHIPAADQSVRQGKWERNRFVGTQLAGKTLGVVGLGRVGREVARRAAALDMKVIGFDPFLPPDRAGQLGVVSVSSLQELLPIADFITVHTPLTDETRHLIGEAEIAQMKRSARLINCARGGIIHEEALAQALRSGHLAGAAVDVYTREPPGAEHPLVGLPQMVLTPHLGASTLEAQEQVAREAAQLLVDFLMRGVVQFAVNMAAVDRAELAELRPFLDLAHRLGLLHAQMAQGGIQRAQVSYRGDIARRNTHLVTAAFTVGLLELRLAGQVNLVNADVLARERGLEIVEQINPAAGDFSSLIQAEVTTEKKTYSAAGTQFGNQFLRLVQLGPYRLDTFLDGVLLIMSHKDLPGLIGHVGTIFGKHQVNIAQMTVGRQVRGGEAIAVLNLDSAPPDDALAEVRNHPHITSLSVVRLPAMAEVPSWLA